LISIIKTNQSIEPFFKTSFEALKSIIYLTIKSEVRHTTDTNQVLMDETAVSIERHAYCLCLHVRPATIFVALVNLVMHLNCHLIQSFNNQMVVQKGRFTHMCDRNDSAVVLFGQRLPPVDVRQPAVDHHFSGDSRLYVVNVGLSDASLRCP